MALITNVSDYEELAKQKLQKMVYDFYASGAEDQWTLKENRDAFSRIWFRPRVLIDVSCISMSMSVLSYNIFMPIMVAPPAFHKLAHPEGEVASARAAAAAGTIMVWKITPLFWINDELHVNSFTYHVFRRCLHGHLVVLKKLTRVDRDSISFNFQYDRHTKCYILTISFPLDLIFPCLPSLPYQVFKDRKFVQQLVRKAENAGYKAIAITVDAPRLGRREADVRNRFSLPENVVLKCFNGLDLSSMDKANTPGLAAYVARQIDSSLSWKDIKWLQTITRLPILVKGVITAGRCSNCH